jgi:G:T-mismatch repair DNA endonuclease (very short patch repair protein)
MERIEQLRHLVSKVDYVWECEIDDELRNNILMKEFFTDCQTKGRINPRDAAS